MTTNTEHMNNTAMTVDSEFIHQTMQAKKPVAVFLSTGVKLQGIIAAYDEKALKLKCTRDNTVIIVYCAYITTISDRDSPTNTERGSF